MKIFKFMPLVNLVILLVASALLFKALYAPQIGYVNTKAIMSIEAKNMATLAVGDKYKTAFAKQLHLAIKEVAHKHRISVIADLIVYNGIDLTEEVHSQLKQRLNVQS